MMVPFVEKSMLVVLHFLHHVDCDGIVTIVRTNISSPPKSTESSSKISARETKFKRVLGMPNTGWPVIDAVIVTPINISPVP